jgi:ribonuclease HI
MNVVFIRKMRNTRSTWAYLSDHAKGTFEAPDGELYIQMGTVVDEVIRHNGEDITVVSPQMNADLREKMEALFPDSHFMPINEASVNTFFERAFTNDAPRKRTNPNILHISSDASGGHSSTMRSNGTIVQSAVSAAWCWASDGPDGRYEFGNSGMVNINVSEYEGIVNAIVSNVDAEANRVHIYSDSANAVDMVTMDLFQGIIPREARKYGLVGISEKAMEAINIRKARGQSVTVEWVKGHRAHRLNMIADSISRLARKKFMSGYRAESFIRETDAMYAVFNRKAKKAPVE